MTTTITPGDVLVTITESFPTADSLNGAASISNSFTISSASNLVRKIVTINFGTTNWTGLLSVAATRRDAATGTSAVSSYVAGSYAEGNVKYLRITNKDDAASVTLLFRTEDDNNFALLLEAGQTYLYSCDSTNGTAGTVFASSTLVGAGATTLVDLSDIVAVASGSDVDLEVFAALD